MCGIWALVSENDIQEHHESQFMKIVGRGPDLSVIKQTHPNIYLGFHRLAIVTVSSVLNLKPHKFKIQPENTPSEQPISGCGISVVCNGEIYNHEAIKVSLPNKKQARNIVENTFSCDEERCVYMAKRTPLAWNAVLF